MKKGNFVVMSFKETMIASRGMYIRGTAYILGNGTILHKLYMVGIYIPKRGYLK